MKKKLVLTLLLNLCLMTMSAQMASVSEPTKYFVEAPDGSVSLTIFDNSGTDTIRIESADSFYKYQILDLLTGEPVVTSNNRGKGCTFNKLKIANGQYNLRIYTQNFIITTKIAIVHEQQLLSVNESLAALN